MKFCLPIFIILLLAGCGNYIKDSYNAIYPSQVTAIELDYMFKTLASNSYLVVDFRSPKKYDEGHINRALSLSYSSVESLTNIPNYKDYKIVFYDEYTIPYFIVERQFKKMELTNYYILQEGYREWTNFINQKNN